MKCFRRDVAREIFPAGKIDCWSFDVEILCAALKRGYRVIEVPVVWYYGERSKVDPVRDTWRMLKEVI